MQTVQILGRIFFRAYVIAMLTLLWDNKAFYGLPMGLLFGYLSEFENLTKKKKEEGKEEITHKKNDEPPTFEIKNFDSQPNLDDSLLENIPKLDYETLRHQVEASLRVAKDMKYGNYNIAGLILSDLKLYIEKNSGKHDVSTEMRKFAEEYSVWLISNGQKYINALSPDFTTENHMDIFIRDYYGKNWMKK